MKILVLCLGAIGFGLLSSGCKPRENAAVDNVPGVAAAKPDAPSTAPAPVAMTQKLPRLVDLGADKCIPCKMMKPALDELTKEYAGQLSVVFIDVWKNRGEAPRYGIRVIPTQIFFDANGKELFRHEGFYSKKDILAKWAELGVKLTPPPAIVADKNS